MRDINVTKYRKLLNRLQRFCTNKKFVMSNYWKRRNGTDYERGYVAGRQSAFNEVLRELEEMIRDANGDWKNVHCREEKIPYNFNNKLFFDPVEFALVNAINDLGNKPDQNAQISFEVTRRVCEIWKKLKIYGLEVYGFTYDEFLKQLENKRVVFYTDEELKDHLEAKEVIKFIKRIKEN